MFGYIIKQGQWHKRMCNVCTGIVVYSEMTKRKRVEYVLWYRDKVTKINNILYIDKKLSCSLYNHMFNYSDSIKLNSTIKFAANHEITKDYTLVIMNCNLQEVK